MITNGTSEHTHDKAGNHTQNYSITGGIPNKNNILAVNYHLFQTLRDYTLKI